MVADVLAEAGLPLGQRKGGWWTLSCPLHQERTPSFYYQGEVWHCFGCGAKGNARQLRDRLGVARPTMSRRPTGAILGLEDDEESPGRPSRTRRILALLRAQSHAAARRAGLRYREADRWLWGVQAVLRAAPPDREGVMQVGMEWLAQQNEADAILHTEDAFRLVLRRFLT